MAERKDDTLDLSQLRLFVGDRIGPFFERILAARDDLLALHVIGSAVTLRFDEPSAGIVREAALGLLDDGPAKPVEIWGRIGRRPILAGGNANGDLPMLRYTEGSPHRSLCLLLDHDDPDREFAYTAGAEKALETARDRDWVVVSVRDDFAEVFAG